MKTGITAVAACLGIIACAGAEASPPNILFIAVDDLKPQLGCYGDSLVQSPNIDRLAARGTVFLKAYCQQAVCGPTRASLLTGLRPDRTGVWDLKTRLRDNLPNAVTLPQYFKNNGYYTVGFGKIFDPRSVEGVEKDDPVSWSCPYTAVASTPDLEFGFLNAGFVARVRAERARLEKEGTYSVGKLFKAVPLPSMEMTEDVPDNAYTDGVIAEQASVRLKELAASDEPFFLAVGFRKPHLPFVAPKKYWDLYDGEKIKSAPFREHSRNGPEIAYHHSEELRFYGDISAEGDIPISKQRDLIHGYYACVSYMDAQVGRLLDTLDALHLTENTIICLWGDHGWHLGDHGLWCKHTNFEQATRAPLIIVDPRKKPGQQSVSLVEFVDIFPTLCEAAGLPVPEGLDGTSLAPVLKDSTACVKPVAVSQYPRKTDDGKNVMGYAFRDQRYRYVEWIQKDFYSGQQTGPVVARELYDYSQDPLETRNVVDDPGYADTVQHMKTLARQFFDD